MAGLCYCKICVPSFASWITLCSLFRPLLLPELKSRNHTPPCSDEELFFAERSRGHGAKNAVVDMASLVLIGFCIYFQPEGFVQRPAKFSKIYSVGGGGGGDSACFLLPWWAIRSVWWPSGCLQEVQTVTNSRDVSAEMLLLTLDWIALHTMGFKWGTAEII